MTESFLNGPAWGRKSKLPRSLTEEALITVSSRGFEARDRAPCATLKHHFIFVFGRNLAHTGTKIGTDKLQTLIN